MEEDKILLEWEEWDGKIGLRKNWVKKIQILDKATDVGFLKDKVTKSEVQMYGLEKLELKFDEETGNFKLERSGDGEVILETKNTKRRKKTSKKAVKD